MKSYRGMYYSIGFILLLFASCNLNAKEKNPYIAYGEMTLEESSDYEVAGLQLYLLNKADIAIESFTLVFYVFDENGNIPAGIRNNLVFEVVCDVEPNASVETILCMDKYLNTVPDEPYQIDYLYLSKINYADGTSWADPFGFNSF